MHPGLRYQMYHPEKGLKNNRMDPGRISYIYGSEKHALQ